MGGGGRSAVIDTIVIGGGPSGMMAAFAAARRGLSVTLLEKNEKLGKKLFITGKGRCNLTNASGLEGFIGAQRSNPRFLYSAFHRFSDTDLMELVEGAGCPLKVERGGRVFPVSDHSSDVIRALEHLLVGAGVTLRLSAGVSGVTRSGDIFIVRTGEEELRAMSVIVATGGLSYPQTGSTGDGYAFAASLGIGITPCAPSLCSLHVEEEGECAAAAGLSLRNVGFRLSSGAGSLYADMGEILFTHTGLSGPLALTASSFVAGREHGMLTATIDLKPALSGEKLDQRLLREIELSGAREIKNFLRLLLPVSLIGMVTSRAGLDPYMRARDMRRGERLALADVMKKLEFHVTGTGGYDEAIVTRGGVRVEELDPRTMEARRIKGLYFAGEVIDIDALTGGYNLQNAFSTGFVAGSSVRGAS